MVDEPALNDPRLNGIGYEVIRHRRVSSLEEAAQLRGLAPSMVVKTMVVRRDEDDFVFVLVPGDRVIDWPKLRALLGERRLTMADEEEALRVTGYRRGTITPFGARRELPVVADQRIASGLVSVGAGEPGASLNLEGSAAVAALKATVADVTKTRDTPRRS